MFVLVAVQVLPLLYYVHLSFSPPSVLQMSNRIFVRCEVRVRHGFAVRTAYLVCLGFRSNRFSACITENILCEILTIDMRRIDGRSSHLIHRNMNHRAGTSR